MRWYVLGVAACVAALAAGAAPSEAAFPGTNGRLLVSRFENGWDWVYAMRANGRLGEPFGRGYTGAWSPDGRRLAFADPDLGGIFVAPADRSKSPSRLASGLAPTWSPDGRRIAFVHVEPGRSQLRVIAANGPLGPGRALTDPANATYTPSWSPDGRWIAYGVGDDRDSDDLVAVTPDGRRTLHLTTGPAHDFGPAWSPDATKLAFARFTPGEGYEIYVLDLRTGETTQLTSSRDADNFAPVWSPDGKQIAFARRPGGAPRPWVMSSDGSGERPIAALRAGDMVLDWQRTIDLAVSQRVRRGRLVTVTIDVRNRSPGPSVGARIVDRLPPTAALVSARAPRRCTGKRVVTCPLGTIAAGGVARVTLVVRPRVRFTSRVSLLTRQVDPRPQDNRSAVPVRARSLAAAAPERWSRAASVPLARTEVAAAATSGQILVVGGYTANGDTSGRADIYSPRTNRWRRLPDLPVAVNHAMAAGWNGRFYVVGGYVGTRQPVANAFTLVRGRWQRLRSMPGPRAAAGAAIVRGKLYVVGGVAAQGLARSAFVLDLRTRRWTTIPGPTPREHLAATAAGGGVYALAGRRAGLDTNVGILERYTPGTRRWRRLAPVPHPRGGTGAAAYRSVIVSVGGEEPRGTIASVYAYNVRTGRWRRLADLPTPRHGLGVVAVGARIYTLAGGPRPGLTVSSANEFLHID